MRCRDGSVPTNFLRFGSTRWSAARFGSLTPTIARVRGSDYPYPQSPIGWLPSPCPYCAPVATPGCVAHSEYQRFRFPNALHPIVLSRTNRRRRSDGTDVQAALGERSARHRPIGMAGRGDSAVGNAAAPGESTNATRDSRSGQSLSTK